jgi:hypothetical protein
MQTRFQNLNQLKTKITKGQLIYLENYAKPELSRVTKVVNVQSYFFTVDKNGKESWIINGATDLKKYGFSFEPDFERVNIYFKNNEAPYLTLHFNDTIINGKMNKQEATA